MDFSFPPAAERLRAELRAWLAATLTPDVVAAGRRRGSDPDAFETCRAWDRTAADAGWAAIAWPRASGGRDATPLEQVVFAQETTRAHAPLPVNVIGINNIAPAIVQFGTDAQRSLLPRMLRADDVWCQGMSEPEAGSDLAALRTRAVRDGDHFVVTGRKIWTSLGHRADLCQLYVRTDPDAPRHRGLSCLLLDMSLPGVEARPLATLTGATDFAEVFLDEVRVPADALLGPLDGGWTVATTTLGHERAAAARLSAELRVTLDDLVGDLADADDAALDDPAVQRRLGGLAVRLGNLEALCRRSLAAPEVAGLAKTVWGELGQDVAAAAFDLLGPDAAGGRWAEHRLGARALTIAGGTTQVTRNVTAQRILGLPRS